MSLVLHFFVHHRRIKTFLTYTEFEKGGRSLAFIFFKLKNLNNSTKKKFLEQVYWCVPMIIEHTRFAVLIPDF